MYKLYCSEILHVYTYTSACTNFIVFQHGWQKSQKKIHHKNQLAPHTPHLHIYFIPSRHLPTHSKWASKVLNPSLIGPLLFRSSLMSWKWRTNWQSSTPYICESVHVYLHVPQPHSHSHMHTHTDDENNISSSHTTIDIDANNLAYKYLYSKGYDGVEGTLWVAKAWAEENIHVCITCDGTMRYNTKRASATRELGCRKNTLKIRQLQHKLALSLQRQDGRAEADMIDLLTN